MRAIDQFFAYRPLLWIPAIALFEAGRLEAGGGVSPSWRALPPLLSLLAILGAVHVANGWRDRAGDRRNRKGGAMAAGDVSAGTAVRLGGAALFAAVVAAGAPSVGVPALLLLSIALLLGAAYTIPPLEWKRRPGVDLLAQGAGYGVVAFLLGASTSAPLGPFTLPLVAASLPYAWGVVSVGIVTMLADREGDALAGQRTTVVAWGASRSAAAAAGIALLAAVSGFALRSWVPALGGLLAAGLVLFASPLARPAASQTEERSAWNRVAILTQLAFLLLLAFRSPAALVAAVGIAAASAIHERRRGGAGYPFRADEVEREPVG